MTLNCIKDPSMISVVKIPHKKRTTWLRRKSSSSVVCSPIKKKTAAMTLVAQFECHIENKNPETFAMSFRSLVAPTYVPDFRILYHRNGTIDVTGIHGAAYVMHASFDNIGAAQSSLSRVPLPSFTRLPKWLCMASLGVSGGAELGSLATITLVAALKTLLHALAKKTVLKLMTVILEEKEGEFYYDKRVTQLDAEFSVFLNMEGGPNALLTEVIVVYTSDTGKRNQLVLCSSTWQPTFFTAENAPPLSVELEVTAESRIRLHIVHMPRQARKVSSTTHELLRGGGLDCGVMDACVRRAIMVSSVAQFVIDSTPALFRNLFGQCHCCKEPLHEELHDDSCPICKRVILCSGCRKKRDVQASVAEHNLNCDGSWDIYMQLC